MIMATPSTLNRTQAFPESLHDISQSQVSPVGSRFLNPGTPTSPLANMGDMPKASIGGNGDNILRSNLIKG